MIYPCQSSSFSSHPMLAQCTVEQSGYGYRDGSYYSCAQNDGLTFIKTELATIIAEYLANNRVQF